MSYELWDVGANFFLGRFEIEEDALRFVRGVLEVEGDDYADNLELAIGDDGGLNLSGRLLAERARKLAPVRA